MTDLRIKRFLGHSWLESWTTLTEAERASFLAKLDDALQSVGGKRLMVVVCTAAYAVEQWGTFGLEIFPDQESAANHAALLDQLGANQYLETTTTIGAVEDLQVWLQTTLQE